MALDSHYELCNDQIFMNALDKKTKESKRFDEGVYESIAIILELQVETIRTILKPEYQINIPPHIGT